MKKLLFYSTLLCSVVCALPLHGMEEEKKVTLGFDNEYRRHNSPIYCYLEHPGYKENPIPSFEVKTGNVFELAYTDEQARTSYSVFFHAGKRPASEQELQFFFQEHPDANPDDAGCIHTRKLVEFKLNIKPYTRISHAERTVAFPPGNEIWFTIEDDEEDTSPFSVLVGVAQNSKFVPSRDLLRESQGIPIKNQRARIWSMNTPMVSQRVIELLKPN